MLWVLYNGENVSLKAVYLFPFHLRANSKWAFALCTFRARWLKTSLIPSQPWIMLPPPTKIPSGEEINKITCLYHTVCINVLTFVLLNPDILCLCKQCRFRWKKQLIWICTVCHSVYELLRPSTPASDYLPWQITYSFWVYIQSLTTASGSRLFGSVVRALDF